MSALEILSTGALLREARFNRHADVYFSVDVETDGPIPGPYSLLSFAIVVAGVFDGNKFLRPADYDLSIYKELRPISERFQLEALKVNGLDRSRLASEGLNPMQAMTDAAAWIKNVSGAAHPVLVAYPLSFDWTFLYWYFLSFSESGSPFSHSSCFDLKTAFAVKGHLPIGRAGRSKLPVELKASRPHTHNAVDDAIEQAEIFANIFEWSGQIE